MDGVYAIAIMAFTYISYYIPTWSDLYIKNM